MHATVAVSATLERSHLRRIRPASLPALSPFDGIHVRHKDPLGPTDRRRLDRARVCVGGDAVDGVEAGLPAAARASLVRASAWLAHLSSPGLLLVVVPLRRLRAARVRRGGVYRCLGRLRVDRGRDGHVGVARARSTRGDDLRLGALCDRAGSPRVGHARRRRRDPRAHGRALPSPRRPRACAVLRADALGQGRRAGRADPADLAGIGDRPRHQGRELDPYLGVPRAIRPNPAVRPDLGGLGRLQPAARGPPWRLRGPRRPEHRRHPRRPRRRAREAQPLGEDQPFAAGRRDPACALCGSRQDTGGRRQLSLGSQTRRSTRRCAR